MIKAEEKDKTIVTDILCSSFEQDYYMKWLLEKSTYSNKLSVMMDYVFDETLRCGEIYLTTDCKAVALWTSDKREKFTFHYLLRNLSFLNKIGIQSTYRILKMNDLMHRHYPKDTSFYHLYFVGVDPEHQGKKLASMLLNPILEEMKEKHIPVYLETASEKNVAIYQKKGFEVYHKLSSKDYKLFFMKTPLIY